MKTITKVTLALLIFLCCPAGKSHAECRGGIASLGTAPMCTPDFYASPSVDWEAKEAAREEMREYRRYKEAFDLNKQGIRAFDNGDYKAARALFENAEATDSSQIYRDNISLTYQAEASVINDLGRAAYDKGDYQTAIALFTQASSIDPHYSNNIAIAHWAEANVFYLRAKQLFDAKDFGSALAFYEKAEAAYPDEFYRYHIALIKSLQENARYESEAREARLREKRDVSGVIQEFIKEPKTPVIKEAVNGFIDPKKKSKGTRCAPSQDASVVDLCIDGPETKVTVIADTPTDPVTDLYRKELRVIARNEGWQDAEVERLDKALRSYEKDYYITTKDEVDDIWAEIKGRSNNADLARLASGGAGPGFPGAGLQKGNMDCAVFALANAAGLPYGVAATRAAELVRQETWRDKTQKSGSAQETIERIGLTAGEVIMLTEALGQVEVVKSESFDKTLKEGRPLLVTLKPMNASSSKDAHQVVLTKTFQGDDEKTWYEMMDSHDGPLRRSYLEKEQLELLLKENGIAYKPEPGAVPRSLK